jgi:hypothetical protein
VKNKLTKKTDTNEQLVREIRQDFEKRREARRNIESEWLLNINFLLGNQYAEITSTGEITDFGKQYFWQEREVYNHIAPIIETRLAKLARVKAGISVRPATDDDKDVKSAKFATRLLSAALNEADLAGLTTICNYWAEVTGTCFYKIGWNPSKGGIIGRDENGEPIMEGELELSICPPYEIYPDTLFASDLDACNSIIHARAYPVSKIEEIWGEKVEADDINVINMDSHPTGGGLGYSARNLKVFSDTKSGHALVIEHYSKPCKKYPDGKLVIIAGDKLLYNGILPYCNRAGGERGFPFARHYAISQPGSFYGLSLIDRLIPVQRAYNGVKNRKHEFLNRLALGVMTVEDGSVDIDNLEEEGLSPGKVLIYRQGSPAPRMMPAGSVPAEFRDEEDRLLTEFITLSGISDFVTKSNLPAVNISGIALSLLIEQDDTRLTVTAESIRNSVKEIGRQTLALFKQFASKDLLNKIAGDNGKLEQCAFEANDISCENIVFDSENELSDTPANRKNMAIELLKLGLLGDENGKLSTHTKVKLLEVLGFGNWEASRSLDELHIKKAEKENRALISEYTGCDEVDEHDLHIKEHIRCVISDEFKLNEEAKERIFAHIRSHRKMQRLQAEADALNIQSN